MHAMLQVQMQLKRHFRTISQNKLLETKTFQKIPFLVKMRDYRATRALENHDKTLQIWNKLNKFMSSRRSRAYANVRTEHSEPSLMISSDFYRKRKEIVDKLDFSQSFQEKHGSFAWALSLRNSHSQDRCTKFRQDSAYENTNEDRNFAHSSMNSTEIYNRSMFNMSLKESCVAYRNFDNFDNNQSVNSD